jgi:hypothetical protein
MPQDEMLFYISISAGAIKKGVLKGKIVCTFGILEHYSGIEVKKGASNPYARRSFFYKDPRVGMH